MKQVKKKTSFIFGDEPVVLTKNRKSMSKKACPFCGAENNKLVIIAKNQAYCIRCMNCLTMGPLGKTDLDAVKFWENGVYAEIGIKKVLR